MSIDYSVYFGAYFECKTKKLPKKTFFNGCNTPNCKEFHKEVYDNKYCPKCGSPTTDIEKITNVAAIFPYDDVMMPTKERITEAWGTKESLTDGTILHRYISNMQQGLLYFDPKQEDSFVEEVPIEKISNNISTLEKEHQNELSHLRKVYGTENVMIKWGLIFSVS